MGGYRASETLGGEDGVGSGFRGGCWFTGACWSVGFGVARGGMLVNGLIERRWCGFEREGGILGGGGGERYRDWIRRGLARGTRRERGSGRGKVVLVEFRVKTRIEAKKD